MREFESGADLSSRALLPWCGSGRWVVARQSASLVIAVIGIGAGIATVLGVVSQDRICVCRVFIHAFAVGVQKAEVARAPESFWQHMLQHLK